MRLRTSSGEIFESRHLRDAVRKKSEDNCNFCVLYVALQRVNHNKGSLPSLHNGRNGIAIRESSCAYHCMNATP